MQQLVGFREFIRKLAQPEWVKSQDARKMSERAALKQAWCNRAQMDPFMDDIIFGYTDIFPVDEQTALAHAGSKDHLDIIEAAGVYINMAIPSIPNQYQVPNTPALLRNVSDLRPPLPRKASKNAG